MASSLLIILVGLMGLSQPIPENIFQKYHRGVFTRLHSGQVTGYTLSHQAFVCFSPEADYYCVDKYLHDSQDPQSWPASLYEFENVLHADSNMVDLDYDWIENLEQFCQKSSGVIEPLQTKIGLLTTCKVDSSSGKVREMHWYAAGIVFPLVKSTTTIGYSELQYDVYEVR